MIHAEDESHIQKNIRQIENLTPLDHPRIRPPYVAEAALLNIRQTFTNLPSTPGAPIIIAHISTQRELDIIRELQDQHWPVFSEVTLHHLFLSLQDFEKQPALLKTNPPLRRQEETIALQQALQHDCITFVSSDHAPHTLQEKARPAPPSGVPGMEYSLLLLFDWFLKGQIVLQTIINSCTLHPCKYFNLLETGQFQEGFFADCTVLNPTEHTIIDNADVQSKAGYTPFHGRSVRGRIEATIVNGQLGFWKGAFFPVQPRDLFPG
jgi:dihydroorotase